MRCPNTVSRLVVVVVGLCAAPLWADQAADDLRAKIGTDRGIVAVIGLSDLAAEHPVTLARDSELTVYFQTDDAAELRSVRESAEQSGLLGSRLFADAGPVDVIPLADNLADCVLVAESASSQASDQELLRVLRPRATAYVGGRRLVKPVPPGIDEWSHPYHGPDNNPQSSDQYVKGDFRTQFLGFPKFSPMPEQTVVAGGRIYKATGHIAHKANQNEMLNKLLCINAYNGTVLWQRSLPEGFMIHRNTMIATQDALYLGDHESCKVIDARTGQVRDEITVDASLTDGPVWKWMAMRDGVLYALVGNPEIRVSTQRSARPGLGHWPWGMWEGHDYDDPRTAFGYGRTLVAIDTKTKDLLWHYRDEEFLDARAVCMNSEHIFCYCPEKFLACINAADGKLLWKNADPDLLEAIGPNGRAQHYVTGYATTAYMKCQDNYVFFAGPQRARLVVASAEQGKLAWTYPVGNLQLVLRDDAIWAAGPQPTAATLRTSGQVSPNSGVRLDYGTGTVLDDFPARRACTRATGCLDSIFYRASGGTVRVLTESNTAQHIDPMRPPCQDGVIISNGHLYWGPWMCGCQLSLYGNIGLSPAGDEELAARSPTLVSAGVQDVKPLEVNARDWTSYRGDNRRSDTTDKALPQSVELLWQADVCQGALPTAPVVAGGLAFVADRRGVVSAWDGRGQQVWKAYTSGPIYYPPAVAHDRVYVGSADGRVYAFEAVTGRPLWSYRLAPRQRWIPVYGHLVSTWPVSGGVVVQDDTVYAAAGIAHYDGTHVVALDAVTGREKARNDRSGTLEATVNNGISLQGHLSIVDGELRFLAGGVYETARYDLETLECLNVPKEQVSSQFRTAFAAYYPNYARYVSLDYTCDNGCTLSHDASYEGSRFTNLALQEPLPPGTPRPAKEAARWVLRRGGTAPELVWQDEQNRRFSSFVISGDQMLATFHPAANPQQTALAAINITDGSDQWRQLTPALAVPGGTAVDHQGRILVSLENGQLLCYGPTE